MYIYIYVQKSKNMTAEGGVSARKFAACGLVQGPHDCLLWFA